MKLSILDQSPVLLGTTSEEALKSSVRLAKLGEELGYARYWITEHHGMEELAGSVPEVLLSYIGSQTNSITIGTGAILLPHYKPYKVAEIAHTLLTLFPNRIDLGIGRAPGGSTEAQLALSGNFLENVKNFPSLLDELLRFILDDFPDGHFYNHLKVVPKSLQIPNVWLLGTSKRSAILAAEKGMGYAFGHFMSNEDSEVITKEYIKRFKPSSLFQEPYVILACSVICSDTNEKAESIATKMLEKNWLRHNRNTEKMEEKEAYIQQQREKLIKGDSQRVNHLLTNLMKSHHANEIMVITNTINYEEKFNSYRLLKAKPYQ